MTKPHTPSPWHVNGVDTILSVAGNRSVAKVFNPESDAKLIAAAPDLLAALKQAETRLEQAAIKLQHLAKPSTPEEMVVKCCIHARDLARAAIEAAEPHPPQ